MSKMTIRQGLAIAGVVLLAAGRASAAVPVVTMLGDSITAGRGLPAADALPARLQAALAALGVQAEVRGAGVSGDTAEAGLDRVGFSVAPDTRLCIVELGANDYLQSVPPDETRRNLQGIVRALKARHIAVLLLGGTVPKRGSGTYAAAFDAIFPDIAASEHVRLDADFLAPIGADPSLRQADGLHPNARGVTLLARDLAPVVAELLRT